MNKILSIYLKYIHNLDITLGQEPRESTRLMKYRVREGTGACGKKLVTQGVGADATATPTENISLVSGSGVMEATLMPLVK